MKRSEWTEEHRARIARARAATTPEEDAAVTAAAESDPDNPPLTDDDFARMKPARGRPRGAVEKVSVTIRLDVDIVDSFKAGGRGWQTEINRKLREAMPGKRRA